MVARFFRPSGRTPLAQVTISLYELPMEYPSVRWQQTLPPTPEDGATADAATAASQARLEWLARTAILLIERQTPLLTRELQTRVIDRLDEFVDYRIHGDRFARQPPLREEGGFLLGTLETRIVPGRTPELRVNFHQQTGERSAYSILATLLDGFASDSIRTMPSTLQSWSCVWLTYLIQWWQAGGPAALPGKASRHPAFFTTAGLPEPADFPGGVQE